MAKRCYYEILGVSRTCTEVELKGAFRKQAMQLHPDKNPGDKDAEARFKDVNEAYQVLSDEQKRAAYDRFGHAAFEHGRRQRWRLRHGRGFRRLDGRHFRRPVRRCDGRTARTLLGPRARRRPALQYGNHPGRGFSRQDGLAENPDLRHLRTCAGSGAKSGSKPKTCSTCGGAGRVRAQQGFFSIERACPACHGRGEVIDNPCPNCSGAGRVTRERSLSVNIPAGIEDGTRIRLTGEGEAGLRGGPAGDLYIFLSVKPHPFFQREGADLHCRAPITMVQAALGGEIKVRGVDGTEIKVKVDEGTQSGRQFKIKSGMPVLRSRDFGDLYIQANVETPQNLTKRQKEILAEFENESTNRTHPESTGFFAKMKDFFDLT